MESEMVFRPMLVIGKSKRSNNFTKLNPTHALLFKIHAHFTLPVGLSWLPKQDSIFINE